MNAQDAELIRTGLLIHAIERLWHKGFDRHVKHLAGITRPQWWLLISLMRDTGAGMTQVELARALNVGKVPLGKMLDRLEKVGLTERLPDMGDRRSKRVKLTRKGCQLIARMESVAVSLSQKVMRDIELEQRRMLNSLLGSMKRNLQTLDHPPLSKPRVAQKRGTVSKPVRASRSL